MIAKFTRGSEGRVGIRFEPENLEEQILLEMFAKWSSADYEFKFSSWEMNHPGRAMREDLTSVWGELMRKQPLDQSTTDPDPQNGAVEVAEPALGFVKPQLPPTRFSIDHDRDQLDLIAESNGKARVRVTETHLGKASIFLDAAELKEFCQRGLLLAAWLKDQT